MTDEEWERLKDSTRANQPNDPDGEVNESRRKLDRDMDRLERVLKRAVGADPRARERRREEDERWREFARQSRKRFAEISAFAARSDQKLKALMDDIQNARNKRRS